MLRRRIDQTRVARWVSRFDSLGEAYAMTANWDNR